MKNIIKNLGLFALLLLGQNTWGQLQNNQTDLLKPFEAKLEKSKKYEATPHLSKIDTNSNKNLNYIVPTHLTGVTYSDPNIRPLAMPQSKPPKAHNFYAKAGFGYPISPLVELSYHNNTKNLKYGLTAKHHSILKGYLPNQNFTKTGANANLTYFTDKGLAVGGYLGFDYNTNSFYGMDSLLQETINPDSLQQSFFNIEAGLNVFNGAVSKSNFNYRGDLDFYYFSDKYKTSEISISPNIMIEKWFGKGKNSNPLRIDLGMNYVGLTQNANDSTKSVNNRLLVYLHPTFLFKTGDFKARLGVNLGTNEGKFFIHPDVELSYTIAKGALTIYGGAVGQVRQNSFRSMTRYNPYLVSNPELHHTNYLEFFGGLKGLYKKTNYDIKVGYALTQNMPYFLNNNDSTTNAPNDYWRFKTVYDTTSIIFLRGGLDFKLIKNLTVGGTISYNIYTTKNEEKAWHLPTFQGNFFLQYDFYFNPKKQPTYNYLSARAEFFINAGVPYLDASNTQKVLQGLYDFNFNLNYKATKNFSLFLDVNNIIHNQNQRWYGYRQIGFNAMIGLEVVF